MKRTLAVARMHTVAWPLIIGWPIAVLAIAFAISYGIFALIPDTDNQYNFTGSVLSMYGFAVGFYIQAMTQTFPFALGISVTRREFFSASALVGVVQSLALGTFVYIMSVIEAATGGFGVKLRMFGIARYVTDNPMVQWLAIVFTLLLVASVGAFVGVIYQRYRVNGLYGLGLAAIVVFGGGALLATWRAWWPRIGDFFVDTPALLLLIVIPIALTAVFGAAGWSGLRRASA